MYITAFLTVGQVEFNWVELLKLFIFKRLMDEMRVLPRRIPKAGKTKPNSQLFSVSKVKDKQPFSFKIIKDKKESLMRFLP
jgi:hypothetical protein